MVTSNIQTKYDYKLSRDLGKDEMHDWMHKLERHIMNREVNDHVSKNSHSKILDLMKPGMNNHNHKKYLVR